jgi:hypothetical protein
MSFALNFSNLEATVLSSFSIFNFQFFGALAMPSRLPCPARRVTTRQNFAQLIVTHIENAQIVPAW